MGGVAAPGAFTGPGAEGGGLGKGAHLRELRVISALIASGDARRALTQARASAHVLAKPRLHPEEQLVLLRTPAQAAGDSVPAKRPAPRPDCDHCPHRRKPGPEVGHGHGAPRYNSPKGRVLEALLAVADCPAEDDVAYKAAWERLRKSCKAWLGA